MNSTQMTKIAAAIVMSLLVLIGIGKFTGLLYAPHAPEKPGFVVEVADAGTTTKTEAAPVVDFASLMASADVAKGQKLAKKCISCHTFDKGGKNGTGPNLYNILASKIGTNESFTYSKAFVALKAEDKAWGYDELSAFIKKPKDFAKGTKMTFGGMKKDAQRADLIAYLRTLSDAPVALP